MFNVNLRSVATGLVIALISFFSPSSQGNAATLTGTLALTINGSLSVAGTGFTSASCNASVFLIPATNSGTTLSSQIPNPWLSGAFQQGNARAAFAVNGVNFSTAGSSMTGTAPVPVVTSPSTPSAGSATGFKCVITVPYTFTNSNPTVSAQNVMIVYTASAKDNGGPLITNPNPTTCGTNCVTNFSFATPTFAGGKTTQTQLIALPPASGTTTSLSVNVKL